MLSSTTSNSYFHSRLPSAMVNSIVPKHSSTLPPSVNIMDTQFTFGKVNPARGAPGPNSSKFSIANRTAEQQSHMFATTESHQSSPTMTSIRKSKRTTKEINLQPPLNSTPPPLKLRPIQQQEEERRKPHYEPQTLVQKLRSWWSSSCCTSDTRYRGMSPSW